MAVAVGPSGAQADRGAFQSGAYARELGELGRELDAERVASQLARDLQGGAGADEGIEHDAGTGRSPGEPAVG